MTRSKGRTGRPWRRIRAQVLAANNICGICGEPIDMSLKKPDPKSPSVDHIVSVDAGGALLDPNNLRPAHLGCNSRKGNGLRFKAGKPRRTRDW